jgi:peptidoglycan lytic transglycosylase G
VRVWSRLGLAAVALAALALLWALFQPLAGDGGDRVRVVIPRGATAGEIGESLDRARVVPSAALFELRALLGGDRDDLKPGTYYLREGMSYGAVLDRLTSGPPTDLVQLTVPEGLSRAEIAVLVRRAGLGGDYAKATSRPRDITRVQERFDAGERPQSVEGFLFPATYELKRGAPVGDLVSRQVATFDVRLRELNLSYAREKNLTPFDVVTIASMVEREAQIERERPLIAAVIYNRLRESLPLGIDATIRYATGNWTSPLTRDELAIDSPYNTRSRAGLPPGPIGNPGLDSLRAAARPARVGYLYYVVKPGTCGEHAFSSSFERFERDQERYRAAREAAGGRSPTDCP